MNMDNFFNLVAEDLQLGKVLKNPVQVTGGFMHRMFKAVTEQGSYIIKLLNPNIMKRPTAMGNYKIADDIETILKQNNIPAVYALEFKNRKMQELNGQYYYVFEWYDAKSLKDGEIKSVHCEKIGEVLAKIHNIDLKNEPFEKDEMHIDWQKYIELAKDMNSPIYDYIKDYADLFNNSITKGNEAIKKLPPVKAICHNDMDSKNVLWLSDEFKLIDLECLGYSNPYLELFELALCWSGYEGCNINFNLFNTFFKSYFYNTNLDAKSSGICDHLDPPSCMHPEISVTLRTNIIVIYGILCQNSRAALIALFQQSFGNISYFCIFRCSMFFPYGLFKHIMQFHYSASE